ncbi:MAG: hypothetical protein V8S14_06455 [Lachnospiraceae bacterium]
MDQALEEQREKNQKLLEELRKEYEENHEAYAGDLRKYHRGIEHGKCYGLQWDCHERSAGCRRSF